MRIIDELFLIISKSRLLDIEKTKEIKEIFNQKYNENYDLRNKKLYNPSPIYKVMSKAELIYLSTIVNENLSRFKISKCFNANENLIDSNKVYIEFDIVFNRIISFFLELVIDDIITEDNFKYIYNLIIIDYKYFDLYSSDDISLEIIDEDKSYVDDVVDVSVYLKEYNVSRFRFNRIIENKEFYRKSKRNYIINKKDLLKLDGVLRNEDSY